MIFTVTGFSTYTTEETPVVVASSSSSGGGGSSSSTCTTDWTCTLWTSCVDGTQTRTCSKVNANCDINEAKPAESQTCSSSTPLVEETTEEDVGSAGSGITGAAIGSNGTRNILIGVGFIIIIIVAYLIIRARRSRSPFEDKIKMIKSSA